MTAYYILYISYMLVTYVTVLNSKFISNKLAFFMIIILVIMASIRYDTGTDFMSYLYLWQASIPIYEGVDYRYEYFEVGFRYLTSFIKMFSENSVLYFFSLSFISLYIFYMGVKKYPVNVNLAVLMYLCVFYLTYVFNGMGQAITMSIFIFSLNYIFENKFLKILLITTVAVLLHKSGIFILFAYLFYRVAKKVKINYLYYIGIPFMFIVYKMNLLIIIFSIFFSEMIYTYTEVFAEKTSVFQMITRFVIISILFYFYKKSPNNTFYKNVFLVYLIGFLLYIGFSDFNMLATRINMFFRITEILLFSNIIMYSKNLFTKNSIFLMIVVIYSYSYFTLVNHPDFFYKTIF